jgi:hypothetical protein
MLRCSGWCHKQLFEEGALSLNAQEILMGALRIDAEVCTEAMIGQVRDMLSEIKSRLEDHHKRLGEVYLVNAKFFSSFRKRRVRNMSQADKCIPVRNKPAEGICRIQGPDDLIWRAIREKCRRKVCRPKEKERGPHPSARDVSADFC